MTATHEQHRRQGPTSVATGVVTVSDSRTLETDRGGSLAVELLEAAGHRVAERRIVADEPEAIRGLLAELTARDDLQAILLTGGTGIARRDQTYETICELLTRQLPGYGELFRMLSFAEIGAAAMLSRAVGGLIGTHVVLTMPGSPAAVRLALEQVILPELGHLVAEARK